MDVVSRAEVPAILVIVSTSVNGPLGMLCATSGSKRGAAQMEWFAWHAHGCGVVRRFERNEAAVAQGTSQIFFSKSEHR
jgi:hypothetical protein